MLIECTDYDSMGNHSRFPMSKKRKASKIRKIFAIIISRLKVKNEKI